MPPLAALLHARPRGLVGTPGAHACAAGPIRRLAEHSLPSQASLASPRRAPQPAPSEVSLGGKLRAVCQVFFPPRATPRQAVKVRRGRAAPHVTPTASSLTQLAGPAFLRPHARPLESVALRGAGAPRTGTAAGLGSRLSPTSTAAVCTSSTEPNCLRECRRWRSAFAQ